MKLVLVRHSKTERDPNTPITCWGLTTDGIKLAQELSNSDIIKNLGVLYASFQTKALETAVLLAKPNGIPIKADNRLTEITSFTGPFEKDVPTYTRNLHDYYTGVIQRISGGETKDEALTRFTAALTSVVEAEKSHDRIGIVSHGHILALFSALYKDVDCLALHAQIKQPDIAVFDWSSKTFDAFFGEM